MNLFEDMRRANVDFYTANLLAFLGDEEMQKCAAEAGITVEELRRQMTLPHIEMTCPLCGRASTHLTLCKGCGGDAFGFEMALVYSEGIIDRLRQGLSVTLHEQGKPVGVSWEEDQIKYAVSHAYKAGGCMICADCWHHTLPYDAFRICPIYLHHERIVNQERKRPIPFLSLVEAAMNKDPVADWIKRLFAHWCEIWNAAAQAPEEKQQIACWRSTILHGALAGLEESLRDHKSVARTIVDELKEFFGDPKEELA